MASGELAIPEFSDDIDFDDLIIESEIGQGAFGKVYKGTYFGTDVAIKQIAIASSPEERTFLKREVAILKSVRHPNVVQFVGVTTDPHGSCVIVTDYVPGGNLRRILKDAGKPLPWTWRVKIAADIAGGMAYLHVKNLIFRDLKSKNILVHGNNAKICDFGLARATQAARPMTICGTDDWMAPEVILGLDYGQPADVFSFGIVLLEIISRTKISLNLQRTPMDAFALNRSKAMSFIDPESPPPLTELVFDCCQYDPPKRPNFKQIVQYLQNLMKALPKDDQKPAAPTSAAPAATSAPSTEAAKPRPLSTEVARPPPPSGPEPRPSAPRGPPRGGVPPSRGAPPGARGAPRAGPPRGGAPKVGMGSNGPASSPPVKGPPSLKSMPKATPSTSPSNLPGVAPSKGPAPASPRGGSYLGPKAAPTKLKQPPMRGPAPAPGKQ